MSHPQDVEIEEDNPTQIILHLVDVPEIIQIPIHPLQEEDQEEIQIRMLPHLDEELETIQTHLHVDRQGKQIRIRISPLLGIGILIQIEEKVHHHHHHLVIQEEEEEVKREDRVQTQMFPLLDKEYEKKILHLVDLQIIIDAHPQIHPHHLKIVVIGNDKDRLNPLHQLINLNSRKL